MCVREQYKTAFNGSRIKRTDIGAIGWELKFMIENQETTSTFDWANTNWAFTMTTFRHFLFSRTTDNLLFFSSVCVSSSAFRCFSFFYYFTSFDFFHKNKNKKWSNAFLLRETFLFCWRNDGCMALCRIRIFPSGLMLQNLATRYEHFSDLYAFRALCVSCVRSTCIYCST